MHICTPFLYNLFCALEHWCQKSFLLYKVCYLSAKYFKHIKHTQRVSFIQCGYFFLKRICTTEYCKHIGWLEVLDSKIKNIIDKLLMESIYFVIYLLYCILWCITMLLELISMYADRIPKMMHPKICAWTTNSTYQSTLPYQRFKLAMLKVEKM